MTGRGACNRKTTEQARITVSYCLLPDAYCLISIAWCLLQILYAQPSSFAFSTCSSSTFFLLRGYTNHSSRKTSRKRAAGIMTE